MARLRKKTCNLRHPMRFCHPVCLESCHTYECVVSHIRMYCVAHINESCHKRVMFHIRMSYVARMNETSHKYEWSCYAHINKSSERYGVFTYEWFMLHLWRRQVIRINDHVTHIRISHVNDMTYSNVWHLVAHMKKPCLRIRMRYVTHMNESSHIY